MLKEGNFWLTTVEAPVFTETPLPPRVDVAVIGGGLTGLSAARTLADGGASVAVLEAYTVGWGASSRNGGMVLTGMKLGVASLIEKYGMDRARRLFELSLASIDTVERLISEEGIDCSFSRCGHLEAAWKPAHYAGFQKAAEIMQKELGHSVRMVPKSEMRTEIGSDLYQGGLVDETSAGLNPGQYVMGLARAAARAGAGLYEHTQVLNVESAGPQGRVLRTSRGSLRAERVFVATSGYTRGATPALERRIVPIGSYIIVTEPLPADLARSLSPHNRMIFDSKNFLYYFRLTPDDRLLFGGRAAFTPETGDSTRRSAEILRQGMVSVFPQLRSVATDYAWGGTLDFAYDLMPHTGAIEGIDFSLGYAGHGVAFATHLGQLLARQILGEQVDNPLEGLAFPGVPLYRGNPVLHLPLAGLYYRFLDLIT